MKQIFSIVIALPLFASPAQDAGAAETDLARTDAAAGTAALPLTEVILYSSGVGYFQRGGEVEGRAKVDLRFKVDDVNDLLKSMVVQDFDGGRVSTVTYGSRDPVTKTLKSFGIDLTENPTLGQLLNQVRGEAVEIMRPGPASGTIVGVERKLQPVGENKTVEVEFLNLLTDEGFQSVPLSQIQRILLRNERLNTELRQALAVLATSHDTQKKTVGVEFEGQGKRKVAVSYIAQTPVWKTSYRLVLDDKEKPFLQGWAIVENTTDEDWKNVQLSLVSGRPISFTMDLYQPLYTTRPVVEPELYLSLRPQVYGDSLEKSLQEMAALPAAPAPKAAADAAESAAVRRLRAMSRSATALAGPAGGGFGGGGMLANGIAQRGLSLGEGVAAAQGSESGELFQYNIRTPVTLARQQSAMLPIVSQSVEGEKVSIYNESVQAKRPLHGFRLKNNTALHLMQGPVTVFDGGAYAGDARIEDLAAGQERLISYALDLKTEVESQHGAGAQELLAVKIRKGTFVTVRKATDQKTYLIKNRDHRNRIILVEHPFRSDWTLAEPKAPAERTRDVYRFPMKVESDKTAKLEVREEKQLEESIALTNFGSDTIAFYLRSGKLSAKVKEALQRVVELRDRVSQTTGERTRREQRVTEISQEQARIRENMARLNQQSELYTRYVKKFDQQETELENLRQEIETLKTTERKQQQDLNAYLLNLDVE